MRVHVIAVPYDSARRGERMGAGPEALLRAGLVARLVEHGHQVETRVLEAPADSWRAEIRTAFDLAQGVAKAVRGARAGGAFPLVLSGNCGPAALGTVAGIGGPVTVFWMDAHGDFNTPETTVGGFLDGMALATLTGRCWAQLAAGVPGFRQVPDESVALIGARDLDSLEATALGGSAVRRFEAATVRQGLPGFLESARGRASTGYLHLDLDILDPAEGVVNSYAVPGGLSRADVEWAIGVIGAAMPLGAAALTAFDPRADATGRARDSAIALAAALVNAAAPTARP